MNSSIVVGENSNKGERSVKGTSVEKYSLRDK